METCDILVVYHEIKVVRNNNHFPPSLFPPKWLTGFLFVTANSRTVSSSVIVHVWASCYWFPGIVTKLHFIKHYKLIVGLPPFSNRNVNFSLSMRVTCRLECCLFEELDTEKCPLFF